MRPTIGCQETKLHPFFARFPVCTGRADILLLRGCLRQSRPVLSVQVGMEPAPSRLDLPGSGPRPQQGEGEGQAAQGRSLTKHFSGMPGVSTGSQMCRVQDAQIHPSPPWLHICLL